MTTTAIDLKAFFSKPVSIFPLVVFRVAFGLTMAFAGIRFLAKGWVADLYLNSPFRFSYYGFSWVTLPSSEMLYLLFVITIFMALCIAAGFFYRFACITYFLIFTYIELLDKSLYLNHYYFVSLVSFLLIFLPANRALSIDIWKNPQIEQKEIANIFLFTLKVQLTIVYFFAGIAKLNSEWLLDAQPLKIWLPARAELPVIGMFLDWSWTPYIMSWSGMFYDLLIPFFLFWHRSRPLAYVTVIVFHILTWVLFNIGVFPWVMIASTLIFFTDKDWKWLLNKIGWSEKKTEITQSPLYKPYNILLASFFLIQVLLPLRHFFYPGKVTWNEMGFRYSWNVMRVEKTGYVEFTCVDPENGRTWQVYPKEYVSIIQEKQMAFQPDMILEFAHFLEKEYGKDLKVYARAKVSLNGAESKDLVDSSVDLTEERDSLLGLYSWVLNYYS